MKKMYYVVFNNDMPLEVCESEEAADCAVAARRAAEAAEARQGNFPRSYFHWHDVPASKHG